MKYIITLNKKNYEVDVTESAAELISITPVPAAGPPPSAQNAPAPNTQVSANNRQSDETAPQVSQGQKVLAPMPGSIVSIAVTVGESVKAGQVLLVFEAMKMENEIVAPADGVVKQILTQKGASISTDEVLLVL
ncbi:MAG: biotin/lipoyl-binding protein [Oscillospiraceae bacterium]|jgi:biotin carboxyl carrier protein|nr:biotin/lipoyl-binding protein [Oscillospiraceae bacterium]